MFSVSLSTKLNNDTLENLNESGSFTLSKLEQQEASVNQPSQLIQNLRGLQILPMQSMQTSSTSTAANQTQLPSGFQSQGKCKSNSILGFLSSKVTRKAEV